MRKLLASLVLGAAATLAFAGAPERVKIVSQNIRDGFDTKYSTISKDKQVHYDNFVNFMRERDPDILCLQELCTGKGFRFTEKKLEELAAKYGHRYSAFLNIVYGLGVTSKYPIEVVTKHPRGGFGHGFMHVRIRGLNVIVTHLAPQGYRYRQPEADLLLKYVAENKLERCLIMGDMNARSPFDDEVLATKTLAPDYRDGPLHALSDRSDYSVISKFLAYPMVDTVRLFVPAEKRMTCPAHFDRFPQVGERLDYIFATQDLAPYLKGARNWNDTDYRRNSDHAAQELELDAAVLK